MKKVLFVFGTRPEAIKMAPLIKEFQKYPNDLKSVVCVTGQHREMLDQVLHVFIFRAAQITDVIRYWSGYGYRRMALGYRASRY